VLNASRHHRKNRTYQFKPDLRGVVCSTPRGITGKIAGRVLGLDALDARAQRLAASPEKSLPIFNDLVKTVESAQRLAASPEKSQLVPHLGAQGWPVLNASRHHRKNRSRPQSPNPSRTPVLNASRHHRKNRP